jgi:hypothetical protein
MKEAPQQVPDLVTLAGLLAHRLGCSFEVMQQGLADAQLFLSPGSIVDDEKPLTIGTMLNLRREFPGTPKAERDVGWVVSGYTRKRGDRWTGYTLARHTVTVERATMSNCEAFDLLERYEPT